MTVVTLSAKADRIPVNQAIRAWIRIGRPPARCSSRPTAHSNTPVVLRTPTVAIMAASRNNTLRSSFTSRPVVAPQVTSRPP